MTLEEAKSLEVGDIMLYKREGIEDLDILVEIEAPFYWTRTIQSNNPEQVGEVNCFFFDDESILGCYTLLSNPLETP